MNSLKPPSSLRAHPLVTTVVICTPHAIKLTGDISLEPLAIAHVTENILVIGLSTATRVMTHATATMPVPMRIVSEYNCVLFTLFYNHSNS